MIKKEDSTQLGKDPRDTKDEVAPTMTELRFSRSENSCIIWCGKNQTRR